MIVVADSGSTKADWRFIASDKSQAIQTMGFNPVFHSSKIISEELSKGIAGQIEATQVDKIFYYGSGCWDKTRKSVVSEGLKSIFQRAEIDVHHDLLGAARATCGTNAGIACIIGTGSNTCLFDGSNVTDNVTNLGYLLGDEGSGTHLGKKIIRSYFYREMPEDLQTPFEKFVGGKKDIILNKVYGKTTPNVYLASFTRFLSEHINHPYVREILKKSFSEFIDRHVMKYSDHQDLPVHFIGSIAFVFQDVLLEVLADRQLHPGSFIKQPIENLVTFHAKYSNDL